MEKAVQLLQENLCCLSLITIFMHSIAHLMFSVGACLVFVASTERKISLLHSAAIDISLIKCDVHAADHVVRFTRPSHSVFAYCKRSKTGAGEGLGTRLVKVVVSFGDSIPTCMYFYPYMHVFLSRCLLFRVSLPLAQII